MVQDLALESEEGGGGMGAAEFPDAADEPQAWADAMGSARCDAYARCGCTPAHYSSADPELCQRDQPSIYFERALWASQVGATLSASCFEMHRDTLFEGTCTEVIHPDAAEAVAEAASCKLFAGAAELGEACESMFGGAWRDDTCVAELTCRNGQCVEFGQEGEPCSADDDALFYCGRGLWCVDGVCAPPVTEGGACDYIECEAGLYCEDEACVPVASTGESCSNWTQCESHRCIDDRCEAPVAALCDDFAGAPQLDAP